MIEIDGTRFFTAQEVAAEAGVSRQTIWRWRRMSKIPAGNRFRNGQVLYGERELDAIRRYAYRLVPLADEASNQLSIFD